ncbi:hypothetical protein GWL_12220 [Herbaspirillum sp. GW103]|nr:hypothetical protein GWL_12220 [Herbaspirillum sp. GW103]
MLCELPVFRTIVLLLSIFRRNARGNGDFAAIFIQLLAFMSETMHANGVPSRQQPSAETDPEGFPQVPYFMGFFRPGSCLIGSS